MTSLGTSDQTADLLHNLSLDSDTTTAVPEIASKSVFGIGSVTSQRGFCKDGFLSTEGAKESNPNELPNDLNGNKGSNQKRLGYVNSYFTAKGSYAKRGYPTGLYSPSYHYPAFGYDGNFPSGKNSNNLHHYQFLNSHHARTSNLDQSYEYMDNLYPNHGFYGHYMNAYGYGPYGYDSWKIGQDWFFNNGYKSRNFDYGKEKIDGLNELSKGPRARGFKDYQGSSEQDNPETENQKDTKSIINLKDYNRDGFSETYSQAKFFVIKSYSEDDVHKSIKYSVWSSTPNGNKKLDAAFDEANEKLDGCPIFLFFSVNTSGQFVGLAEMVGPVDFNKTVEYWQQDKWIGCFPVKWHIIKDVPNSSLRHIILENNENKPVTNSRDTQEVKLEQGIKIIRVFKDHSSKTCILDDFAFYEARQKIIQERKAEHQQFKKQGFDGKSGLVATNDSKNEAISKDELQKPVEIASQTELKPTGKTNAGPANHVVVLPSEKKGTSASSC